MAGQKTQGTQLYFRTHDSAGYAILKIDCPTGATGLGGSKTQLDATCLDSDEMEYLAGMAAPSTLSVPLNFDINSASHLALLAIYDNSDADNLYEFVIGWPTPKDIAPTVSPSTGIITYPTTRTFISFFGYIADYPIDFAVNALVKSTMTIQRSGPRTIHKATT